MEPDKQDTLETNSLESPSTVVEQSAAANRAASQPPPTAGSDAPQNSRPADAPERPGRKRHSPLHFAKKVTGKLNVYLLAFILVLIVAGIIVFVAINSGRDSENVAVVSTQELTQETIDRLRNTDATIGDAQQILSIESNAVFAGKVLIRDSLELAGTLTIGGELNAPSIAVGGVSQFDQLQANSIAISGDTAIQGATTIQNNLTVSGSGTFGGPLSAPQLSIDTLQLNNDLQLNRHIDAGGATPGRTNGAALGSGGTSSVNGTDTAGTVTVNTGGSPSAGCFITVTFAQAFNATPHVVITPVGSDAAQLSYYISRNTAGFSVCTASTPAAGRTYIFDYIAID